MGFGAIKIYDKTMKLIKKISAKEVSKTFWNHIHDKTDLKLKKKKKKKKKVNTSWNATHHNKKGTDK